MQKKIHVYSGCDNAIKCVQEVVDYNDYILLLLTLKA